jgi:DNA-binding transcriptional LysR family regulator
MASSEQAQALRDRRIDIGLVCPPFPSEGLEVEVILRERLIVALARKHVLARRRRIPLMALANETIIFTNCLRDSGYLAQLCAICQAGGFELRSVRDAHTEDAILPLIASGLGVCLAPASARKVRYSGVVFRDLENCPGQVELGVAWRKQDGSPMVKNFLDVVRESRLPCKVPDPNTRVKNVCHYKTRGVNPD